MSQTFNLKPSWVCTRLAINANTYQRFDIETLSSNRRSKVRRGLKRNEIVRVDNVEPYIDQLKDVVISARERTGDGKPVSYYQNNFEEWKNYILRLAPMKDRDFWLAFQEVPATL